MSMHAHLSRHKSGLAVAVAAALLGTVTSARAVDINDQLSVGGIIAATGQCQAVSARLPAEGYGQPLADTDPLEFDTALAQFDDECRGGMPVQFEIDFHPTDADQFFVKVGWAVDNGLNEVSPFRLAPWAADLEDDVEDINGRSRDYLLTAWYKRTFALGDDASLGTTFGIIDTTDYLDGNAYANDEYTQFMNEVFVNAGNYNLPSYDAGAAIEALVGDLSFTAVGLNIGENDQGNDYNFWGAQIGWHPELKLGPGNYRIMITGTSSEFAAPSTYAMPDPDGEQEVLLIGGQEMVEIAGQDKSLLGWGLSLDQAIGDNLGLFLRLAWQETDAAVDYEALYSGGINIAGNGWQRPSDNIGIGYAYLEGGNTDVRRSSVLEAYYRAQLNDFFAVTADLQYMSDDLERVDLQQDDPEGWIFGLRITAAF